MNMCGVWPASGPRVNAQRLAPGLERAWGQRLPASGPEKGPDAFQAYSSLPQLGPLPLHLLQHGAKLRQALALLFDHGGGSTFDEVGARELAVGLADLGLQAGDLLVQPAL